MMFKFTAFRKLKSRNLILICFFYDMMANKFLQKKPCNKAFYNAKGDLWMAVTLLHILTKEKICLGMKSLYF